MSYSTNAASLRRQTRLRRDYLYRKSKERGEESVYERKQVVRKALEQGGPGGQVRLPTEVRADYDGLKREIDLEDALTGARPPTHVDDEYGDAGLRDPAVCVTTSRDPSSRLKKFAVEFRLLIPNSTRINRGGNRVDELVHSCRDQNFTDLIVLQETRGEPDGMVVCHLPLGPTAYFSLSHSVLRHDLDTKAAPMSEAYPHVILHNFGNTPLGRRVGNILKCLFPVPKPDTRRIVTFSNDNDFISFRHHMYSKTGTAIDNPDNLTLHEVGPRFEMRLFQIKLGTMDQKHCETEYVLRPYMNTSSKKTVL